MSARATIKAGDLNRLLKAAKAHGFVVELPDGTRFLPREGGEDEPVADSPAQKALAAWRRSA